MFKNKMSYKVLCLLLVISFLFSFVGCSSNKKEDNNKNVSAEVSKEEKLSKKVVIDMDGRKVEIPKQVEKIATIGSVPVINGLVFAIGEGDKIINALPQNFTSLPKWKYQTIIAPTMADKPVLQDGNRGVNIEELIKAKPDLVLTMDKQTAEQIEKVGINVVYLSWTEPDDVKRAVTLLGEIFDKQSKAEEYIAYFDDVLKKVNDRTSKIGEDKKVRALYSNIEKLSQPHLIAEWWISAAGGISVTNDGRQMKSLDFSMEQLLKWNPEVLIVANKNDLDTVYKDEKFKDIKAVANKRVYITPTVAHVWANRTIEQPLTVLWAAKLFYPEEFKDIDLKEELKNFSQRFFDYKITDKECEEILGDSLN